jgi:molybdenum cofactor cytidylyltransferase
LIEPAKFLRPKATLWAVSVPGLAGWAFAYALIIGAGATAITWVLHMISAILLAAGESRRMGEFKQLLRIGNKSFVEHCIDNILASRVDELIIVTGYRALEVHRVVGNRPVKFAHNADYQLGMASSIKCGFAALSEGSQACVVALVDQPKIGADVIDLVIECYRKAPAIIVIPTYLGRNGHPILLDNSLKGEILSMDSEKGLRQVVRAHDREVARVEVHSEAVLEDCDLPEDYQRILKQ